MSDASESTAAPAEQAGEQPEAQLPALPSLVLPEIKITDENAVVVAASRLRVIRDQYAHQLGVPSSVDVESTLLIRQQFQQDIEEVIGLLDRAWQGLHGKPDGAAKTAQPE